MLHLYFFVSSKKHDTVRRLTISTTSVKRAYALACKYFMANDAKGQPMLLAI